jgi:hypothetical protein
VGFAYPDCPLTVDKLNRIFVHYVEYCIVVCTTCQFAVVPNVIRFLEKIGRLTYQPEAE